MQKKIAILLVLYNDAHHVPRLIKSLKSQIYNNFDIYAIETSESGSSKKLLKELYPDAITFPYIGNLGFAAANNFLAKTAIFDGADFLFVLNTDMELSHNTLEIFLEYYKSFENLGVISSTLLIGNTENIQLFGVKANFLTQKKQSLYANKNINEVALPIELQVDYVNGGSTFLSSTVYKKAGLFNESFFMYNDEIDFAYGVKNAGFLTMVTSRTYIRHHHNWTKDEANYNLMYYYMNRNKILYYYNHEFLSHLFIELLKVVVFFPITFRWLYKLGGFKLIKYYYLGIFHGLLNEKGKSNVRFE